MDREKVRQNSISSVDLWPMPRLPMPVFNAAAHTGICKGKDDLNVFVWARIE